MSTWTNISMNNLKKASLGNIYLTCTLFFSSAHVPSGNKGGIYDHWCIQPPRGDWGGIEDWGAVLMSIFIYSQWLRHCMTCVAVVCPAQVQHREEAHYPNRKTYEVQQVPLDLLELLSDWALLWFFDELVVITLKKQLLIKAPGDVLWELLIRFCGSLNTLCEVPWFSSYNNYKCNISSLTLQIMSQSLLL